MKNKLLTFFFFLIYVVSFSQNNSSFTLKKNSDNGTTDFYHITNFGNTEKKSITCIAQDSIGQMWFATKDGVIRYDTKEFHNYKHNTSNPHSIGGNFVERIFVGKDGSVWIGTEPAVLSKYKPKTDDFETIKGVNGNRIKDIQQDKDGLYWITSNKTLYSYNDSTKKLKSFHFKEKNIGLDRLLIDSNNRIWITTNSGFILEFSAKTNLFRKIVLLDKGELKWSENTTHFSAFHITEDTEHFLWISTPFGYLLRLNPNDDSIKKFIFQDLNELKRLDYKKLSVMFIMEDNNQNLWLGTWFNGMYRISHERDVVTHFILDKDNPNSLTNNIIHSGFQDNAGYMWFGTEFAGLNIIKKNKKFEILSYNSKNKNSLPNTVYNTIATNKNTVWLGTDEEGLFYFEKENPEIVKSANSLLGLKDKTWVNTLLFGSKGYLWVGTNYGLFRYHPDTKKIDYFKYDKDDYNSISSNVITHIIEDKHHNIWVGSSFGLTKFDVEHNKFYRFIHDNNNPRSLSNNAIRALFVDSNDFLWVGTFSGLNKFNPKSGDFTVYKQNTNPAINANRINSIYESNNNLWIGTQGGGLNRLDIKSQEAQYYYSNNGFPFDNIKSINSDNNGNLWLASSKNLIKFNIETNQYIYYSDSDGLENTEYIDNVGLQNLEFVSNFTHKDKQGYLYFGGISGLCFFHPDSLPINNYKSPIVINKLLVENKPLNPKYELVLNANQNDIYISITSLNYIQADKNQYAFYLENYDEKWHYTGTQNSINYNNLPSGNYSLYYKGSNNDKVWNEDSKPIQITIKPLFYKSYLFYFFVLGFIVLIIFAFFLYKIYIKRKIEKERKEFRYSTSNLSQQKVEAIDKLLLDKLNTSELYLEADLSLHKLAKILDVKPNSLSQVINQVHNRNFNEFINIYRVEEAKKLLTETYLKIEAVAYDSGFNSLSTFNTFFKKEVGITPSKYRKQNT